MLTLGVCTSVCLGLRAMYVLNAMDAYFVQFDGYDRYSGDAADGTREDDVRIAGQYTILSTTQISDAYKSGDASGLSDDDKETLEMASKVLDGIVEDGMTDFEKEKAVYDWMVANIGGDSGMMTVIPTTQDESDRPHGVLKTHQAVCVGYATTFRLFMQMLDIPCMVVHNADEYHSWDLVQIDGAWYHTDVYSDAQVGGYGHFNLTDSMFAAYGQTWDTGFWPAATSIKYNMAYVNREPMDSIYDIPARVREAYNTGESTMLGLLFAETLTDEEQDAVSLMLSSIQQIGYGSAAFQYINMTYSCESVDEGSLVAIAVTNYSSVVHGGISVSDEVAQKVDEAVQKAFGDVGSDAGYAVSETSFR